MIIGIIFNDMFLSLRIFQQGAGYIINLQYTSEDSIHSYRICVFGCVALWQLV